MWFAYMAVAGSSITLEEYILYLGVKTTRLNEKIRDRRNTGPSLCGVAGIEYQVNTSLWGSIMLINNGVG